MNKKDYYHILGLETHASLQEIKEAYRKLALQCHPDRNQEDPDALEKMKELNEAYAVLSDPDKKNRYDSLRQAHGSAAYDRFRQNYSEEDIFRGSDINQMFEEMARTFGFRGFDEIFRESYGQGYRTFQFQQGGMSGRGFIFFGNPYARSQEQQILPDRGLFPRIMGAAIRFALKKMFKIGQPEERTDVYDVIALDARDAQEGARVSFIDRRSSEQLIITIPRGIKDGQKIRLRGKGQGGGDLYLRAEIRKPFLQRVRAFLQSSSHGNP
jgi:curved DNA-binding protein CbpA